MEKTTTTLTKVALALDFKQISTPHTQKPKASSLYII